jgi:hypothetical protein
MVATSLGGAAVTSRRVFARIPMLAGRRIHLLEPDRIMRGRLVAALTSVKPHEFVAKESGSATARRGSAPARVAAASQKTVSVDAGQGEPALSCEILLSVAR